MDPRNGAELPQARVGLIVHSEGALADRLQRVEILQRTRTQQPCVIEGLNQRQHDLSVDVVLQMFVRLIADPHRLHAAVALDAVDDAFADSGL